NISVDKGDFNAAYKYLKKAKASVSGKVYDSDLLLIQIEIISNECWINRCKGDYKKAIKNGELALEKLKEVREKYRHLKELKSVQKIFDLEIEIKAGLGNTYVSKGEYTKAVQLLLEVLEYYKLKNDYAGLAGTYNSLGSGFNSLGENQKAEEFFLKSIDVSTKIGNRQGIARTYGNLGTINYFRGNFKKALSMFKKENEIAEEIGNPKGILLSIVRLGALEFSLGKLNNAENYFLKGLNLAKKIGSQQDIGAFSSNLGSVYQRLRQFEKAAEFTSVFLDISKKTGDFWGEAAALNNLAGIASEQGDYIKAEKMFNNALKLTRKLEEKNLLGQCLCYAGANLISLNKYKKAEEYLKESIDLLVSITDNIVLIEAYGHLAELYIKMVKDPEFKKEKNNYISAAKEMIEEGRKLNKVLKLEHWKDIFNNLEKINSGDSL
ncbi:MAG TPA: tetratricopeptide repeat protein, partial [Firmicutes bacterium]|nr:tetratricopeptide repeat protein [Bacillota bacterium]